MSRDFLIARLPVLLSIFMLIVFIVAITQIQNFPVRAKTFPLTVAYPMLILAIIQIGFDLFKPRKYGATSMSMGMATGSMPTELESSSAAKPKQTETEAIDEAKRLEQLRAELDELEDLEDAEVVPHTKKDVVLALVWFFSFFLLIWLIGMKFGIPVYTAVYLFAVSKEKWWWSIIGGAGAWLFIYIIFDQVGHLPFFGGELFKWLGIDL